MSFPRYPAYKDSGVEWLGEVPAEWTVTALKRCCEVTLGKMLQPLQSSSEDRLLPYLRAANIQWRGITLDDVKEMWFSPLDVETLQLTPGDLLVSEGGDVGRACIFPDLTDLYLYQNSLNRVRSRGSMLTKFVFYWIVTVKANGYVDVLCNRSTIAHLTAEKLGSIPVPFPSELEQLAVVQFLDSQTANIDRLIDEQRRLVELLTEKRQAVISHAIAKGLNPGARMKPSGVEWLGDVPAHWSVVSIRRIARSVQTGRTPDANILSEETVDGIPWFTPGDFGDSLRLSMSMKQIRGDWASMKDVAVFPPLSALIVSIGATLGKVGISEVECSANQQINAVIASEEVDPYFLTYSLSAKSHVMRWISNASTIGIMNQEKTKEIRVALPPLSEQTEISEYLDEAVRNITELRSAAQRAIELLHERRTAVISAAVTGKIDVRGLLEAA